MLEYINLKSLKFSMIYIIYLLSGCYLLKYIFKIQIHSIQTSFLLFGVYTGDKQGEQMDE